MLSLKNCVFTFITLLHGTVAFAQNVWEPKADMPTARKEIADAATVLDGKIYVMGGTSAAGTITNVFEMYDPTTNGWTSLAPYPLSVWRASLIALDGKIYSMGGYQELNPFPFDPSNKAFVYDPGTNSWSPIADMISPRGSAASVVLNGQIHLVGGANTDALDSHHAYNPDTDNWSSISSLNQKRSGLTAVTINNKIYAVGGYFLSTGVVSLSSAEMFDPVTNLWNNIASMPFTKLGITSEVVQNKMYVFGNENGTAVLEYDPTADVWVPGVNMPENVNFSGAGTIDGLIYVLGGGEINLATDGIAAVHCFNPALLSVANYDLLRMSSIVPNPSAGLIGLKLQMPASFARIIDISGRLISEIDLSNRGVEVPIQLPYRDGVYMVEVQFENGRRNMHRVILDH
ncbi:MAG: kelch repeat-containing protein [Bacteroidota bacterium]